MKKIIAVLCLSLCLVFLFGCNEEAPLVDNGKIRYSNSKESIIVTVENRHQVVEIINDAQIGRNIVIHFYLYSAEERGPSYSVVQNSAGEYMTANKIVGDKILSRGYEAYVSKYLPYITMNLSTFTNEDMDFLFEISALEEVDHILVTFL